MRALPGGFYVGCWRQGNAGKAKPEPAKAMTNLIVIPARYGSKRLPAKPLHIIAGRRLVERVAAIGMEAAARLGGTEVVVATDDERIRAAAEALELRALMTDPALTSGSARALAAYRALGKPYDLIVNLQGDAMFASPDHAVRIVEAAGASGGDVTTPAVRLDWPRLDALRDAKRTSPGSGTCCIADASGRAVWFTKSIVPFIRDEAAHRSNGLLSPVLQHVGLYCYRPEALAKAEAAPVDPYEQIEGLEQLRFLALGLDVRVVEVPPPIITSSGIDSPADVARAEALIATHGDPFRDWRGGR
jgi:3-deoxy-manno-octulosonate cytidylyltransferase (CMP-KDO synthetase)